MPASKRKQVEAMRDDFAAMVLTHGRADNILTTNALRRCGYTGKVFYVCDDEDSQLPRYRERFGDDVKVFCKKEWVKKVDRGNNFGRTNAVVFARNACFEIAKREGLKLFWQLDDDYPSFHWAADNRGQYLNAVNDTQIRDLDAVLTACLRFFEYAEPDAIAFSQGGDFIGGGKGAFAKLNYANLPSRKLMNSFIMSVEKPLNFIGIINEDVNLYVVDGNKGKLFFTIPRLRLQQKQTQSQAGGLTDIYLDVGTYLKSFTTVCYAPSCVQIAMMGVAHRRIHHLIKWKKAVPLIVSEDLRRP